MKHLAIPFVALLLCVSPLVVCAEDIDVRRHIQVQGTSRLYGDVDKAVWQIRIRGEANTLAEASRSLAASVTTLQKGLEAAGIKAESLRLSGISSGRVYEQQRNGPRVLKGYQAERRAIVEITDLELREPLEQVLLADNGIEIDRVELKSTKHEELRKQSLITAVAAAKAKAEFLAKEAGAQLGLVLAIEEGNAIASPYVNLTANRIEMPDFAQREASEFEKLEYSATVTVKFELR